MKTLKKTHFLLFILLITISSCNKDETEAVQSPLIGTWQVITYETRQGSGSWQNANQPCRLDDTEEYASNGKWTKYDGTNQCASGTGITLGTWELRANNTKIVYTYDGAPGEYESTVELLNEETLVVSFSSGDLNNTQFKVTYSKN